MLDSIYLQVLWETIWSATLWPFSTEMRFHAMAMFGGYHLPLATLAATVGATLGSLINYACGWLVSLLQEDGTSVISPENYAKWQGRALWLMPLVGIFAWVHLLGSLILAAGFLRVKPWLAALSIFVGQGLYYGYHYANYSA